VFIRVRSWLNLPRKNGFKETCPALPRIRGQQKAENVVVLDVRDLSSVTDYFVIASGTSEPHLRAIVDEITDHCATAMVCVHSAVDGTVHGAWVVLDFFDVIVHIMRQEARERYDWKASGATRRG